MDTTPILVDPTMSSVRPACTNAVEVLDHVSATALEQGRVRESFAGALRDRELSHPTGLPTPMPVAIPHADPEHVLRPGLAAVLLDPPVPFGEMGGSGETVDVRLVVVLLVTDPASQVGLLAGLIRALRRPDLAELLAHVHDPTALADAVNSLLAET